VFINKIDKLGASIENTLLSINKRLKIKPLLLNFPIGEESSLSGLIDLIDFKKLTYNSDFGEDVISEEIDIKDKFYPKYFKLREILIEELSSLDDQLLEKYLDNPAKITENEIRESIRKLFIENKITPVLCGSSLKNKGVQQILDAITYYFPSPKDIEFKLSKISKSTDKSSFMNQETFQKLKESGTMFGLIFKIINDQERGQIAFFKLYNGTLKLKNQIKLSRTCGKERLQQLLRVRANESIQLPEIKSGDIGAMLGLKEAQSGDTFMDENINDKEMIMLEGVYTPPPVFFCSINAKKSNEQKRLIRILELYQKEDPSIQLKFDKETGQLLLSGLGELHLEVVKDRVELEHGLQSTLGKMKVSFRESIKKINTTSYKLEREFNGKKVFAEMDIEIYPIETNYYEEFENNFDANKFFESSNLNTEEDESKQELDYQKARIQKKKKRKRRNKNQASKQSLIQNEYVNQILDAYNDVEIDEDNENKFYCSVTKNEICFDFILEKSESYTVKDEKGNDETFKTLNLLSENEKFKLFSSAYESLNIGQLHGFQLVNIGLKIKNGKFSVTRTNEAALKIGIIEAMKQCLVGADPVFMEPFMLLEVIIPNYCSSEVISDITSVKRGKVLSIKCENESELVSKDTHFLYEFLLENKNEVKKVNTDDIINKVYALVPLSELIGYAAYLRSISSGEGRYFMKFYQYDYVGFQLQQKILDGSYYYE